MKDDHLPPSVLELTQFTCERGDDYWIYLDIPISKFVEYRVQLESGEPLSLLDYGEPLAFGVGTSPPVEVRRKMEYLYGAVEKFEQSVQELLEELK